MKQCIAITNSGHRCKNISEGNGVFCAKHRLWLMKLIAAIVAFLAGVIAILQYVNGIETSKCPPKIGQTLHATIGAKVWSQPDVFQGTATKVFQEKVEVFILGGPIMGPIRSDNPSITSNWWKISLGRGQESIGWVWEGRIDECQPK